MKTIKNLDLQVKATLTAAIILTVTFVTMVLINGFRPF